MKCARMNWEELGGWGKWVSLAFSMCCILLYSSVFIIYEADTRPLDEGWFFIVAKIRKSEVCKSKIKG
jgi:hypothetical protein